MAVHPSLLDLQKDANPLTTLQATPFLLSLRDPEEFSQDKVHSFGFFKVPNIGVYGSEYSLCCSLVLLSLPAIPRCLQQLPADLIRALDLESELPKSRELVRATAKQLVQSVLRAACSRLAMEAPAATPAGSAWRYASHGPAAMTMTGQYRVTARTAARDRNKFMMDTSAATITLGAEGQGNRRMEVSPVPVEMDMCGNVSSSVDMETENNTSTRCRPRVQFADPTIPSQVTVSDKKIAAARRGLAKRLVLKCISAACHRMAETRRDSLEYLISSTKRMRISSPNEELASANTVSSPAEVQVERSVTPESMKMQKLRKKRGRSESHEVNSLTDYHMITRHFQNMAMTAGSGGSDRKGAGQSCGRSDGDDGSNHLLGALTEHLGMMTIDEGESDTESEETNESPPAFAADGSRKGGVASGSSSTFHLAISPDTCTARADITAPPNTPSLFGSATPLFALPSSNTAGLPNTTPSLFGGASATPNTAGLLPNTTPSQFTSPPDATPSPFTATPLPTDPRRTANIGSVPGMDLYAVIHSCPPRGMCQKFLCNNHDEINLVYHCWLFGAMSYDPNIALSDVLAMGVFDPSGIKPVHLELQDAGAAFGHLENRSICIHGCCFSPENAQVQLVQGDTPNSFHTFFSAARHGERRVAALHILPSSISMENALRNGLAGCTTLRQLLLRLHTQFPEIGSKIWNLVSLL